MSCGPHCCAIDEHFDPRVAAQELERYRREGAAPSTRQLLDALREAGVAGASVLDVGGGIGAVSAELLEAGAARATVVEASTAYLKAAREEAERRQLGSRMELIPGDFVVVASGLPVADVVALDKVVCCYPEMEPLIAGTTGRALRLYGIVYPRDSWWVRLATAAENAIRRLRGSAFRVYVFSNRGIESAILRSGFSLLTRTRGWTWVVALYERSSAGS